MSQIQWGQPLKFNFLAAKEQGIIPAGTPMNRLILLSEKTRAQRWYEGKWPRKDQGFSFLTTLQVAFEKGSDAEARVRAWMERR